MHDDIIVRLAAEVFQGMHDQVMALSTRRRQLALRLNHLDHAAPQDSSSSFFCHKDYYLFVASNIGTAYICYSICSAGRSSN